MYRTWWAQRKVDGVFLVDLQVRDRRIGALEELGMPAVVIGTPRGAGRLPAVWQDDRATPPTAILYDNDVMAVAGLGAAQRMGARVPADLSIVVWDHSALCEIVHPAFTALRRDIPAAGANAARMLREAAAGRPPGHLAGTPPVLIVRDSATRPPAPATS
jgi:DNA-binding LacI/PurR family transcriptional regulator